MLCFDRFDTFYNAEKGSLKLLGLSRVMLVKELYDTNIVHILDKSLACTFLQSI
jgi:hypothetical protein